MRYGTPYKGSKNLIAQWICDTLPKAENFYDLFAGGCAVSHCALLSGKYEYVHANDLDGAVQLFYDAIHGKYKNEKCWISREDFKALKDTDEYVRFCWSFGNNGKNYLYSKEIEPWKKALHYARVLKDFSLLKAIGIDTNDASRVWIKSHSVECKEKYIKWYCKAVSLQSLERLESLQRLQSLQSLERLQISQKDYREIEIKENSVIYCDIPYRNTNGYAVEFDHDAFYDWCENQRALVVVSEYAMPEERFIRVASKEKVQLLNGKGSGRVVEEGLFIPKNQLKQWQKLQEAKIEKTDMQLELIV